MSVQAEASQEEKKGFKFPTAYTILFLLIIVVAIGTWFIPAGQYDRNEEGQPVASGVYLYRLETSGFVKTKKMVIMR